MKLPKFFGQQKRYNSKYMKREWPIIIRKIHGHSMVPVLPPGTYVWASRWFKKLEAGDTVIFLHENREKIKRISEIKNDELFVLGDHPESSTDSRHFGSIKRDTVLAKVIWPHAPKSRAENVEAAEGQISPDK
jgi:nickel-type superoxide dismutase maturation protease